MDYFTISARIFISYD